MLLSPNNLSFKTMHLFLFAVSAGRVPPSLVSFRLFSVFKMMLTQFSQSELFSKYVLIFSLFDILIKSFARFTIYPIYDFLTLDLLCDSIKGFLSSLIIRLMKSPLNKNYK